MVKAYLSMQTNLHMETAFWENSPLSHINGREFGADFQWRYASGISEWRRQAKAADLRGRNSFRQWL